MTHDIQMTSKHSIIINDETKKNKLIAIYNFVAVVASSYIIL